MQLEALITQQAKVGWMKKFLVNKTQRLNKMQPFGLLATSTAIKQGSIWPSLVQRRKKNCIFRYIFQLNIHKFKCVARFGLVHIVATNLCVWMRTVVKECTKEIAQYRVDRGHGVSEDYMILGKICGKHEAQVAFS